MTISEHLTEFGSLQVRQWNPGDPLGDPATTIHRISVDWDDEQPWVQKFRAFLELPGVEASRGVVVGWWGTEDSEAPASDVVEALVAAHASLPDLRVLFFGDVTYEENEISWIQQADLSPLLAAYPHLTHLGVRGGNNLSLGRLSLPELRHLIVQTGGLDVSVVREVMTAELPALEHLELFLGTEGYGANSSVDDLTPVLDGTLFPKLTYLGLKNSDHQDQIAQVLADAPVLTRLEELDLSLGVLTDEGGQALLGSEAVRGLKKLHLVHHFMSEDMVARLEALPVQVDVSERQEDNDDWRFVALGE
ncbi:STM4015 family protein [Deinococcus yunweiensis]|uniref:STM4015 family protein n=1 Tax=Deinococcus yunweiensis TaxID=367282 RepID=UPI00398EBB0D